MSLSGSRRTSIVGSRRQSVGSAQRVSLTGGGRSLSSSSRHLLQTAGSLHRPSTSRYASKTLTVSPSVRLSQTHKWSPRKSASHHRAQVSNLPLSGRQSLLTADSQQPSRVNSFQDTTWESRQLGTRCSDVPQSDSATKHLAESEGLHFTVSNPRASTKSLNLVSSNNLCLSNRHGETENQIEQSPSHSIMQTQSRTLFFSAVSQLSLFSNWPQDNKVVRPKGQPEAEPASALTTTLQGLHKSVSVKSCKVGSVTTRCVCYLAKEEKSKEEQTKKKTAKVESTKAQNYYHLEFSLFPDEAEPIKIDLADFGLAVKVYMESETKVLVPWDDGERMWVAWNQEVNLPVTRDLLLKLMTHIVTLQVWDHKEKVSPKARFDRPRGFRVLRQKGGVRPNVDGEYKGCGSLAVRRSELIKVFFLSLPLIPPLPSLTGSNSVTNKLEKPCQTIMDAYFTLSLKQSLLSDKLQKELNPLVIRILSVTSMPSTPISISDLEDRCNPVTCQYQFMDLPCHQTLGREHGTNVYFNDVNVILTGTVNAARLREYLLGPVLEIEVHDRDRKLRDQLQIPALFGAEPEDSKLSNVGLVSCKRTLHNPFTDTNNSWDPFGVAKVSLTELLDGKRVLNMTIPIQGCRSPDPSGSQRDGLGGRILGVAGAVDGPQDVPLPMGHYLESNAQLKLRVEIFDVLDEMACPFGRIIYIFDFRNQGFLQELVSEIKEVNATGLCLESLPKRASPLRRLNSLQRDSSRLDILTGFHVTDDNIHLFVLEGLRDGGVRRLWERLPARYGGVRWGGGWQGRGGRRERGCSPLRDAVHNDLFPTAEMVTLVSREFGVPASRAHLKRGGPPKVIPYPSPADTASTCLSHPPCRHPLDSHNKAYVERKREQTLHKNFTEVLGALDPKQHFTYGPEYMSAKVDPVDVEKEWKLEMERSRAAWLTFHGFQYPGFKTSLESNRHPIWLKLCDHLCFQPWNENNLHRNLESPLSRGAWKWHNRKLDFDLYSHPPCPALPVSNHLTGNNNNNNNAYI
uniref:DUF4550 domain-containing protein n=1 Tax=Callorhinchus milii TaxID=7868 RepID=A0A4W3I7Q9_CALMI